MSGGINHGKTVVELFAGVGGFRCGLNKVELIKIKLKKMEIGNLYGLINGNLQLKLKKLLIVMLKDLVIKMQVMLIYSKLIKRNS